MPIKDTQGSEVIDIEVSTLNMRTMYSKSQNYYILNNNKY